MGFKKGDIVVAKAGTPARFRNIKPGTLWKVLSNQSEYGDAITVGDDAHPSIGTNARHFLLLDSFTKDQIRNGAQFGETDLSARLKAIEGFSSNVKTARTQHPGHVRVKVNGIRTYFPKAVAGALAAKNSTKLVQRKLVEKLGGL